MVFSYGAHRIQARTKKKRTMEKAASVNEHFKFNGILGPCGLYIECINNLCAEDPEFGWGILERFNDGYESSLPVGINSYEPEDGQHIVWSYITRDDFNFNIATCGGGGGHD